MIKLKLNKKQETELINRIRHNDDAALCELCFCYQPLINNIKKNYFVRDYDDQDWDQEAMIVCHQAAKDYSADKGYFGPYFKRRLNNHATTLLRRDLAYRRRALKEAVSWELVLNADSQQIQPEISCFLMIPAVESYEKFTADLSDLEIKALLVALGKEKQTEVVASGIERAALVRAHSRMMQKLKKVLFA